MKRNWVDYLVIGTFAAVGLPFAIIALSALWPLVLLVAAIALGVYCGLRMAGIGGPHK